MRGAATTTLDFFGSDKLGFTITSTTKAAPDNARHYTRFSDVARDVIDARQLWLRRPTFGLTSRCSL